MFFDHLLNQTQKYASLGWEKGTEHLQKSLRTLLGVAAVHKVTED